MICASVVLPSPGGPTNSTWSSASPRDLAASMKTFRFSRAAFWPTNSAQRLRAQVRVHVFAAFFRGDEAGGRHSCEQLHAGDAGGGGLIEGDSCGAARPGRGIGDQNVRNFRSGAGVGKQAETSASSSICTSAVSNNVAMRVETCCVEKP